jgi:hypothetical protein
LHTLATVIPAKAGIPVCFHLKDRDDPGAGPDGGVLHDA